jgi:hypothetical protein
MRIGGAFAPSQPSIPITLGSGGQCFLPEGNFLVSLGFVTVLQWWDPTDLVWRDYAMPLMQGVEIESDGYNWRLLNMSGVVTGATITAAGSGAAANGIGATQTGVNVAFAAPAAGVTATGYAIVGGQVGTPVISVAGSGFVAPPLILFDPPPQGGIQATAIATISGAGVINAVTLINAGAGYTAVPNVYVVPQFGVYPGAIAPPNVPGLTQAQAPPYVAPGLILNAAGIPSTFGKALQQSFPTTSGAQVTLPTALVGANTLTGIVMQNMGSNYLGTAIPTCTITGCGAATAVSLMAMSMQSLTITSAGVAYPNATNQLFISSLGLTETNYGSATIMTPGSSSAWASQPQNNNNRWLPRASRGLAICAATTISSTQIEDPGFAFQKVPIVSVEQSQGTPATTLGNLTPVVGGISDVSVIQPAITG